MALALGPQCCCSGPAFITHDGFVGGTFALSNRDDGFSLACWALRDGLTWPFWPYRDATTYVLGYNIQNAQVISYGTPFESATVNSMWATDLDTCGANGPGRSVTTQLFDQAKADDIFADVESALSTTGALWISASDTRIYGMSGERVFSVDYNGDDLQIDGTDRLMMDTVIHGDTIVEFSEVAAEIDAMHFAAAAPDDKVRIGFPGVIGWDARRQALVVAWSTAVRDFSVFGLGDPRFLVSYISGPLSPGNIVGQPGVTWYDFGWVARGNSVRDELIDFTTLPKIHPRHVWVIPFGEYPRPVNLEEVPEEPPDPQEFCALYTDCPAEEMRKMPMGIGGFENCTVDHGGGHIEEWLWENLNTGSGDTFTPFVLETSTDFDPSVIACIAQIKTNFYLIRGDYLSIPEIDRYDDPGILLHTDTQLESFRDEVYVVAIAAETECVDGLVYLRKVHFLRHRYRFLWDAVAEDWDRSTTQLASLSCDSYEHIDDETHVGALAHECRTTNTPMQSTFNYDKCNSGDFTPVFTVRATVGIYGIDL